MNAGAIVFLPCLLFLFFSSPAFASGLGAHNENAAKCQTRILSKARSPTGLNFEPQKVIWDIIRTVLDARIDAERPKVEWNFTRIATKTLTHNGPIGLLLLTPESSDEKWKTNMGFVKLRGKFREPDANGSRVFLQIFNDTDVDVWSPPFQDCFYTERSWMQMYKHTYRDVTVGIFVLVDVDRCDDGFEEVFNDRHRCDSDTTFCVGGGRDATDNHNGYWCMCREGFYHPEANRTWRGFSGEDIENGLIDTYSCQTCPEHCDVCEKRGVCAARRDIYLKMVVLGIQAACMGISIVLALVVFKQRKCKTIASGMWTILETILLGIFLLYLTIVVQFFEPSVVRCLLEPWTREMGFVICYGAIILKLYRHLIEFRTRKAHRWVVKDTDLLKYLLIMVASLFAYMAAYTSISLNFMQEKYSLLYTRKTSAGLFFEACKPLWWDYVTEIGEIAILIFGIHLGYASRNARTQFHERKFLCAAISVELAVSGLFYVGRIFVLPGLHPDTVLIANCLRTQMTATITMVLVFVPKFWYQQKQVRSLAQEYSCRLPVDAFKDVNAHGPLTGNNSDVDVGEVTLADMSPDDIRAELKRLYLQLEIFKSKTICRDNPHISKRRGGRKAQHRRFSLQNLYGKHRVQKQQTTSASSQQAVEQEITEAEPSRTPEDSVCSVEGPSNVYNDLQQSQPQQQPANNTTTPTTGTTNSTSTSTIIN